MMQQMQTLSLDSRNGNIGIRNLAPAIMLADNQAADAAFEVTCEVEELHGRGIWARAQVRNTGDRPLHIKGIRWAGTNRPALHFLPELKPHVYATENLRADYFGTGSVEGNRFFYPLTNQNVTYGLAEDHLFPGVFVFAAESAHGLLVAQASQERLTARFRFSGRLENSTLWRFEIEERPTGTPTHVLAPDEHLLGEKLFFQVVDTRDPQGATDAYYALLRTDGAFARSALNPLPKQRIYCTWNYDFFADIDQEKILAQLPIIKEHLPRVGFVQLDDGYQSCHAPGQRAMIDLCYGDLEHPFDPVRFPDGPKALADRVKAAGLRPAIWLGLWASTGSQMVKAHPDWILRDDTGKQLVFDGWYGGVAILDPSVPGVRDYLDRLCATVFGEWGFEGVKLDFSSFAFNGRRIRYSMPGRTAVGLRHELESMFRRHLPPDGFFGWCVVAGTAQPFLSQADYFRNGIDINHGDWATAKRVAMWSANTNMLLQQRPCLPNLDSIGWSENSDEISWETWLNFAAVFGGAIEVSGDLRKLDANRLARLERTLELSDPARRVHCLDLSSGACDLPPSLWLAEAQDGHRMLGIFNWSDKEVTVDLACPDLRIAGAWRDAWSGESSDALPEQLSLPARASRLMTYAPNEETNDRTTF